VGYFSNGSEGAQYQAEFCENCVHDDHQDCPIWALHLIYNGNEEMEQNVLNPLIPRDGIWNAQCKLYVAKDEIEERHEALRSIRDAARGDLLITDSTPSGILAAILETADRVLEGGRG